MESKPQQLDHDEAIKAFKLFYHLHSVPFADFDGRRFIIMPTSKRIVYKSEIWETLQDYDARLPNYYAKRCRLDKGITYAEAVDTLWEREQEEIKWEAEKAAERSHEAEDE